MKPLFTSPVLRPRCKKLDLNLLFVPSVFWLRCKKLDLGFLIGRFASDGSIGRDQISWYFSHLELDLVSPIKDQLAVFDHVGEYHRKDGVVELCVSSKVLV